MLAFWNGLKVSFLIVGTSIGAGYASGREIWEFFGSYGEKSSYYIILAMFLFAYCCQVIMQLSYQLQAPHYVHILHELTGNLIARWYDLLIFLYLFSTTVVMFAGSGATLEYWSIPYWWGVGVMGLSVFLIFWRDVSAVITLNSLLTPVLITTLTLVCLLFLNKEMGQLDAMSSTTEPILPSALAFTALNILPLVAVLSAVGSRMSKLEIKIASMSSAMILCTISILYNESLLKIGHDVLLYEVPLFAILKFFPAKFMVAVSLMLLVAIYTTAISGIFGMVTRFSASFPYSHKVIAGCLVLLIMPLTKFGFANLIKVLYPLYGVLNLFIMAIILLYPLNKLR